MGALVGWRFSGCFGGLALLSWRVYAGGSPMAFTVGC